MASRAAEKILKPLGYSLDWLAFADAWRVQYCPTWTRYGPAMRLP
jgi:hypothetical protein